MAIRAKLQYLTGDQKGKVVNVEKLPLLLGRVEGCDIILGGDQGVSRKHAELRDDGGRVILTDLGSSAGTTVNQQRVSGEQPLKSGDVIGIGKYQIKIALPVAKAGAVPAKAKKGEEQEGTAFVDMAKIMGADEQEGTAFVDMEQFVEGAPAAAQDGTAAVDMSKLVGRKTLGERWRGLPKKKKILFGSAGGVVGLCLLLGLVAALKPGPKPIIAHPDDPVEVKVDGETKHRIPRSSEVWTDNEEVCTVFMDEGNDAIALVDGIEEGDAKLYAKTLDDETHVWNVTVAGLEDPYKGYSSQERLDKGKAALAEGDEKAKLASANAEQWYFANKAYGKAVALLAGASFATQEIKDEAKKKKADAKSHLDGLRTKNEKDYELARNVQQWDTAILALETLAKIFPTGDPRHDKYMMRIRIMKEMKAGRM